MPYRAYLSGTPYPAVPGSKPKVIAALRQRVLADPNATDKAQTIAQGITDLNLYYAAPPSAASIAADFAPVVAWANSHKIPTSRILLGEFGVLRPGAFLDTAAHYIHDVRTAAEQAGFAWTLWNYAPFDEGGQGFSVLQMQGSTPNALEPRIIHDALGLGTP